MPVVGKPRSYHRKYKFHLEIDEFASGAFQKMSELKGTVAKVETNEGGTEFPTKRPARVSFSDVTLERGATKDLDAWNWFKEVVDVVANSGELDDDYIRQPALIQRARDNSELRR